MRKLKYHEQKLLKHVNLYDWKRTNSKRENTIIRRYRIQDREDYHKYNKIVGLITKLVSRLRLLPSNDEFRISVTDDLLKKLYEMGLISKTGNLELCEKLSASSFCRRRLAVVLVQLKFCQNLEQSTTYIEQGQISIGNQVVCNPAYHISRTLEDTVSWTEGSKILKHIADFHGNRDDYKLLNL